MSDLFLESEHAELYRKYRPKYPKSIFEIIDRKLTENTAKLPNDLKEFFIVLYQFFCFNEIKRSPLNTGHKRNEFNRWITALDVACGTGQATLMLVDFVQEIGGIDASESQIHQARLEYGNKDPIRVTFMCENALNISQKFRDGSVDLILVCQAVHWIDRDKLFKECLKILRPGGVLALVGYGLPVLKDEKLEEMNKEYLGESRKTIATVRSHVENKYSEIFKELENYFPKVERDDTVVENLESTVDEFVGYLSTWSNYRAYKRTNPPHPDVLETFREKLKKFIPEEDKLIKRSFDYFVVFGLK
ncbi:hypothetical protein HELRODRAFT_172300 [Helobdella robusta]|uniref:Methyltransferase type 11 domain-containing protein n=1 Tax=Helobdella robusta TaxID=6412 RepID=T1F570_HELRO|nr:hypothetical protein HELRODRAFT_172300 [Helobdella robusta]ESO04635.1 hypothetical protein HELRODRAFT_172300 [Helobdella robusta]